MLCITADEEYVFRAGEPSSIAALSSHNESVANEWT